MVGSRLFVAAVVLTVGVACGSGAGSATPGPNVGVAGANLGTPGVVITATDQQTFDPVVAHVTVGEIIEWKNTSSVLHNIVFSNDASVSDPGLATNTEPQLGDPTFDVGGVWEVKFTVAGTYQYLCTLHNAMVGTIVVSAG